MMSVAFLQPIDQGWYDIIVCTDTPSTAATAGATSEGRRPRALRSTKMSLAVESGAHLMGNCHRYRGLADAARPDDRHKPLLNQFHLDRGQGVFRPSIRIRRAGSRDLEDGLKSPDVGEENDVTGRRSCTPARARSRYISCGAILIESLS